MALVHEPWHELPDSSSSRSPSVPGSFVPTVRCKSRYCCSMPHDVRLPSYALHVSVRCITSRALVVHRACFCWALGPSIIARGRSTEGGRGTTHTELARPPRGGCSPSRLQSLKILPWTAQQKPPRGKRNGEWTARFVTPWIHSITWASNSIRRPPLAQLLRCTAQPLASG